MLKLLYKNLLKPVLFRCEPESIHDIFTNLGHFLGKHQLSKLLTKKILHYEEASLTQTIHGIKFSNPVGLSAGFDKDAKLISILGEVGFGFTQVGSVTMSSPIKFIGVITHKTCIKS